VEKDVPGRDVPGREAPSLERFLGGLVRSVEPHAADDDTQYDNRFARQHQHVVIGLEPYLIARCNVAAREPLRVAVDLRLNDDEVAVYRFCLRIDGHRVAGDQPKTNQRGVANPERVMAAGKLRIPTECDSAL
jgi:hypothetical protein